MPRPDDPPAESPPEQTAARPREPLYLRLFYQSHLTDLVRLFGYSEIPDEEARKKLKPIVEKYGKKKMEAAVEEIVFIDDTKSPAVARLTDHARKLALQILGSPRQPSPTPIAPGSETTVERPTTADDE